MRNFQLLSFPLGKPVTFFVGAILTLSIVICYILYVSFSRDEFLIACLLLIGILPFIIHLILDKCSINFLSPITYIFIPFFFGTFLRGLAVLLFPLNSTVSGFLMKNEGIEILIPAIIIINFGVLFTILGFHLNSKPWPNFVPQNSHLSSTRFNWILITLVIILVVSNFLYLRIYKIDIFNIVNISAKRSLKIENEFGQTEYVQAGYLIWLIGIGAISLKLYALKLFTQSRNIRIFQIVLLLLLFFNAEFVNFISSARSKIAFDLIFLFFLYSLVKGQKLNFRRFFIIGIIMIFMVSLLGVLRKVSNRSIGKFEEADIGLLDVIIGNRNFLGVTKTAHYYQALEQHRLNYYWGETFVRFIYSPIPKSWWPEKPNNSVGLDDNIRYGIFHGYKHDVALGGVPPGIFMEFFMNFHILGILFGSIFFGMALKGLYLSFIGSKSILSFFIYYYVLLVLTFDLIATNFSRDLVLYITYILPYFLIVNFISLARND